MEFYDLSAASFADKIEVGRSSISHLLSGRNKPSLDFVMKIVKTFPEVELYWLLNGKGSFPKSRESVVEEDRSKAPPKPPPKPLEQDLFSFSTPVSKEVVPQMASGTGKNIHKIVIFYTDGTFDAFENGEGRKRS